MISEEELEELRAKGFNVTAPGGRNLSPIPDKVNGSSFVDKISSVVSELCSSIESLAKGKQSEKWEFTIEPGVNGKKKIIAERLK